MKIIFASVLFTVFAHAEEPKTGYFDAEIQIDNSVAEGKVTFKNGKRDGPFEALTQYTKITGTYKNDKLDGDVVEEGTDGNDRSLKSVTPYRNGQPHGKYQKYIGGKVVESGEYKGGKAVGKWLFTQGDETYYHDYDKEAQEERKIAEQQERSTEALRKQLQPMLNARVKEAERLEKCFEQAGNDISKIQKCGRR